MPVIYDHSYGQNGFFFSLSLPQLCKWCLYQSVFISDIKNVDRRGADKIYKFQKAAINLAD